MSEREPIDLIVVEPNAARVGGHYLDYVDSFKEAMIKRGVKIWILINRNADPSIVSSSNRPAFTFGFWDGFPPAWIPKRTPVGYLYRLVRPVAVRTYFSPSVYGMTRSGQRRWKRILRFPFTLPMRLAILLDQTIIPKEIKFYQLLRRICKFRKFRRVNQQELAQAVSTLPTTRPVLFFTTAGENEIAYAARYLEREPHTRAIMMLRRPLFYTFQSGRYEQLQLRARDQRVADEISKAIRLTGGRMIFCTDTPQLTAMHNRLGVARFHTLPIPHTIPQRERQAHPKKIITYIGDARTEKGFLDLPKIVKAVAASSLRDNVKFFIQCNFNIPGGEPGIGEALEDLRSVKDLEIEFAEEAIPRDAYVRQIQNSDFVLLMYDSDLYRERSSGILVEALSAGASVVIPSGSWLEAESATSIERWQNLMIARSELVETFKLDHPSLLLDKRFWPRDSSLPEVFRIRVIHGRLAVIPGGSWGHIVVHRTEHDADLFTFKLDSELIPEGTIVDIVIDFLDLRGKLIEKMSRQYFVFLPIEERIAAKGHTFDQEQVFDCPPDTRTVRVRIANDHADRELVIKDPTFSFRRSKSAQRPASDAILFGRGDDVGKLLVRELSARKDGASSVAISDRISYHNADTFSDMLLDLASRS